MTENKTALVTGGSRGIGSATAGALAGHGFHVVLTYVSRPEAAQAVVDDILAAGGSARAVAMDTGDNDSIAACFSSVIEQEGRLDVLVNNAGMTWDGLLVRMKPEQWEKVIDVNLSGAFFCLQQAAKIMMKQRSGRIVNVTSVVAQSGNAGQANYVASKAGMIGLTKSAALELAPRNVTVNAVAPGFIETDMTAGLNDRLREEFLNRIPLRAFGKAEDIAAAVLFFCSDAAGYITGQVLGVNGGLYM